MQGCIFERGMKEFASGRLNTESCFVQFVLHPRTNRPDTDRPRTVTLVNWNEDLNMKRFHLVACHVLWRELCYFASLSENIFTFQILRQGLHNEPDKLRAEVQLAIDAAEVAVATEDSRSTAVTHGGKPDAVLLGYALCSNGLMGIRAKSIPIVVPRAHDCITFLLGSKERYRQYFDNHPGTYWYSPGWIDTVTMPSKERFDSLRKKFVEKFGDDNADYLMEMEMGWVKKYTQATYVDLGFGDASKNIEFTKKCAEYCKWRYDYLKGDPDLIKRLLSGEWNMEDFLVVQPGEEIQPSHDELVMKAVKCEIPEPAISPDNKKANKIKKSRNSI
jgi:hypothetical protein